MVGVFLGVKVLGNLSEHAGFLLCCIAQYRPYKRFFAYDKLCSMSSLYSVILLIICMTHYHHYLCVFTLDGL